MVRVADVGNNVGARRNVKITVGGGSNGVVNCDRIIGHTIARRPVLFDVNQAETRRDNVIGGRVGPRIVSRALRIAARARSQKGLKAYANLRGDNLLYPSAPINRRAAIAGALHASARPRISTGVIGISPFFKIDTVKNRYVRSVAI